MFPIVQSLRYNPKVKRLSILAPRVAQKAKPGQFVMIRADEDGERIPLTIADADQKTGLVTIIFQEVGQATMALGALEAGMQVHDLVGPLGIPSHLEGLSNVCVVGGGLGCAIAYPQAKALFAMGAGVDIIAGFRNESLIFLEEDMRAVSRSLTICTDDGSNGRKGLVTDILKGFLEEGRTYDQVIAIGPLIMMKYVCLTTKPYGVPTMVSMNPIMVDGTGMCGCCRVTVGGALRFACVDGPDFDGHQVDFDEAMLRSSVYKDQEQRRLEAHICRWEEQTGA